MDKTQIIAELEKTHGVGKVKIYANGSIFAKGILLGTLAEFSKKYAPSAESVNEQQTMNTGYGKFD